MAGGCQWTLWHRAGVTRTITPMLPSWQLRMWPGSGCAETIDMRPTSGLFPRRAKRFPQRNWKDSDSAGDCGFPVDPKLPAPEASVCWLPELDSGIVVLTPLPIASQTSSTGNQTDLKQDDHQNSGTSSLVSLGSGQWLHIIEPCDGPDCPLGAVIPLDAQGFDRLAALYRLLCVLHDRVVPPDPRLTLQQRDRQQRMLQAFDGRQSGATQQQIASAIYATGDVSRTDWQNSSDRHRVKALLRDAVKMIRSGYRRLLRSRRQNS